MAGTWVGVDPGVNGGIAAIDDAGSAVLVTGMPATEADVLAVLRGISGAPLRAVLELVRSSPQMGVKSAWTFGVGYGGLRMALTAASVPFDEVVPIRWQQALSCRSGGDKNVTKRRAQELFPHLHVTHKTADALLLAEYCRRLHLGLLAVRPAERPQRIRTEEF